MEAEGANTYTGITTLTAGTLRAGARNALSPNSDFAVNGGTLDLNGFDQTIQSLSGSGGLTRQGTGTTTLTGTSNYMGARTVSGGVLRVNGSLTSSDVTVASGGTLKGTGTISQTGTVDSGGSSAEETRSGRFTSAP